MEKSLAEGSQTFEEDLAYLIREKLITQAEGIENADSPSNLLWRLQNDPKRGVKKEDKKMPTFTEDDGPVFSDIELNINHS